MAGVKQYNTMTNGAGLTYQEYLEKKRKKENGEDIDSVSKTYDEWRDRSRGLIDEYKNFSGSGNYRTEKQYKDYFSRLQTQLGKAASMREKYGDRNGEIDDIVKQMSDAVSGNLKEYRYYSQFDDADIYLQLVKAREEQEQAEARMAEQQDYLNNLINTYEQGDNSGIQRMTDIERMFAEAEAKVAVDRERQEQEQKDTKTYYDSLRENEDFKEKSRYVSTKTESPSLMSRITGNDKWNSEQTGDEEYEYINHGAEELGKGVISSTAGQRAMAEVFPEDSARKISDEKKYAVASGMKGGETSDPYLRKGYDYLTRDEIEMYNYIYATQGETEEERKEAAQKYLDSLNLTERMTEDFKGYFQERASEHPVKASVESVPLGMQGSLGYWDDFFRISTDKDMDTNSYINLGGNTQSAIRGQVSKDIEESVEGTWGKVGSWAYGVGMSMADFLATTAVTGGNEALALGIMGSRAAAETVIEAKERGAKDVNAFWSGTAAGIFEMLFEKVSIEQLQMFKQQGADSLSGLIKNVLKGSFTEGSEEVLTTFADTLADCVINGDLSEMSTKIREYMRAGYSEEEAVKMAQEDFAKQLALDFLGGAASGGIMSAGATGLGMIQNRNAQTSDTKTQEQTEDSKTDEIQTENIQEQQEEALPETKEIAQEPEVVKSNRYEGADVELDIPEMQQDSGVEPVKQVVKSRTNEESIIDTVLTNGKVTDNIANEIVSNEGLKAEMERRTGIRLTGTESEQRNSVKVIAKVYAETHPVGMELQEGKKEDRTSENRTQETANATVNGRQVQIIGVTKKNGNLGGLEGSDGRIYNAEDVEFSDSTTGELFQAAQTVADGNSEELSNSFLRNYRESVPVEMYARAYDLFYGAGRNGVSLPDAMKAADMFVQAAGEQAVRDAWQYGQEERVRSNKKSLVEKRTAEKKGTGTYKDETKLDGPMREIQKMVAEKTGIDITRKTELEYDANGKFIPSIMSMVISSHASNEYTAMIHELGEFGLAYDRAGMKALQNTLVHWWATQNGIEGLDSLDTILNEYQRRYAKVEGSKTRAQALDEITNDALGGLFSSESGVDDFMNWLQEDSGLSQKKQKGILQSMADLLKDLIDALKKMVKDSRLSKAARTAIQMEEQQAQEIRKRFLDVLDRASEKAQETGEYISERNSSYSLDVDVDEELEYFGVQNKLNDYIGVQKAVLEKLAQENYYGDIVNEKTGITITLGKKGIKETLSSGKRFQNLPRELKELKIATVRSLPEIIKESTLTMENAENIHNKSALFSYFETDVVINGIPCRVTLDVKSTSEKNHFWIHNVRIEKKNSALLTSARKQKIHETQNSSETIVSEKTEEVKRFSLKEPVEENSVEDVKFSLPEYDSETENQNLLKENEKYKSLVKDLQTQLALDDQQRVQISIEGVNRIVTQIYRDYRSSYDQNTFRKKLSAFFSDVASGKTESRENFLYLAEELLRPVIKESKSNLEISDYAKQVLGDIKGVKITLDAQQKAETAYAYGSYNNFRKANFGRINLGNDGIKLDSIWQEWAEKYPNLFDVDISSVDQPNALADIVASMKEDYVNDYGFDLNDAVSMAALELLESYESLPEVRRLSGGKSDVNLRAKYRQLIDEIKKEYQVKYENQLKEVRKENQEKLKKARKEDRERLQRMSQRTAEQLERQRAKFNERAKKTREQRLEMEARNKYKARIEKNTNTLIGWFNRNSDKNHIPESMKKPAMEFITSLDFLSSRAMEDSKATIELQLKMSNLTTKIATLDDGDADFMSSIDPDLTNVMQDFQEEMKGTKISDMNSRQLRDLDFIMQSLKRSITTANKLFQNQAYEDVEKAGNATIEKLKDKKEKKELQKILGTVDRLLNTDMLDAGSYFRRLGPAAMSVYQEIRNGFNNRVWKMDQAQKYMQGLLKEKNVSDWTGEHAKIHTFNLRGVEVQLTTAQIMNLYLLAKRPQAFHHLVAEGGGFSISQKGMANGQKLTERPVKLTVGEIRVITKELSQEQKAVADAMQRFLADECSKWGNEVSMEMYGYKKFGERTYWPIKTNDNYGRTNDSNSGDNSSLYAIRNQGMTKELVKNASNPIMIGDVFDVFTDHVCNMANYNAFAIPLSDAMKWYNYRMRSEDGIVTSTTKEEIDRTYGSEAKRYFINLMKDINGEVTKGYGSEISDTLTGKYKAAAVGANLRVVVQQPTAYFRAAAVMDPKYLIKAAGMKPAIKECQENSAIAKWKSWGYFETSLGTSMKKVITGQSTMLEKVTEKSMTAAQWADDFTWGVLWNAVKEEVKDQNPGMDTASEEYMELVRTRFDEVVDRTQVVDTVLHRSQIMRSNNGAVKMAVAFMAEPTKNYNLMHTSIEEMVEEGTKSKTSAEYKEKAKQVARTATAFAVNVVITSLAASTVDAFRDDDEDKEWVEKYMESFWANVADNINPAAQIPYVKDIVSMMQGYDVSRMDMAGISTLITAVQQAYKYCTGASNKTMYGIVKGIVRGLSQVLGVPAYNVMREIESVYNTFAKEPISTTQITGKQACKRLYNAALDENTALQKKYLEFLSEEYDKKIEEGKTEKEARAAIMSTVTSYFKPIYQEASTTEKIKIKNTVLKIGAGGKQLYKDYNWSNWDKEE